MKKVVVLPGDGIGPEIMEAALCIARAVPKDAWREPLSFQTEFFGGAAIEATGKALPETTLAACQAADAILMGSVGGEQWREASQTPEQGLLALRATLGLYANIRPTKVSDSCVPLSPLKAAIVRDTDFVIVRELTSGIYFGEPRLQTKKEALDTCRYTVSEIERIVRLAFELAQKRRKKVTSVDKANVLATSKLWRSTVNEVAKAYPEVTLEHHYVDAMAMYLMQRPRDFDVIVTENLFGDILSDEASILSGTLGVLASASHGVAGPSLYEPIHGSAPDLAGKNQANPLSMIYSLTMMLRESFAEYTIAESIERACQVVLDQGLRTADLGGTATTTEMTTAILEQLEKGRIENGQNVI